MKPTLQLRLLGVPNVMADGAVVTDRLPGKVQAILYYMAVSRQPQARTVLSSLLWGDIPEAAARANLRKTLSDLRQGLDDYIRIERLMIAFNPEIELWVDVAAFETLLGDASANVNTDQLQAAADLYRGDFLTGFYVRNAPDFEEWMMAEQARLREMVVQALLTLTSHFAERGELSQGIITVRRLLNLESWHEEAHRQLMGLLAQDGQRSAALAQYEICRRVLTEELGVEPGFETTTLYERIRDGQISQDTVAIRDLALKPERKEISLPQPLRRLSFQLNLPAQTTPFVGREKALADIIRHLTDRDCRLLTLIGPGGIGKTRLALQTAQTFVDTGTAEDFFPHGLIFVPLVGVRSASELVSTIAEAAKFSFKSSEPPRQQLLDCLKDKTMLLILDNLEHIRDSATEFISEVLAAASLAKILVTSREALNLPAAWFHPVQGLPFPEVEAQPVGIDRIDPKATDPSLESYDAVRLFVQNASRARIDFSLAPEQAQVVRICQLVEGIPLAIELAAAWLKVLPAEKIAREIARNLDSLMTRHQNLPTRHQSMRAVFDHSWQLLMEAERRGLKQLAVFRGSFDQDAAEHVTGASLLILAALVEKSLLRVTDTGRYQLHELIRQFAAEQLHLAPNEAKTTQAQHCVYFITFLEDQIQRFGGNQQKQALSAIATDMDNIRAAWDYALNHKDIATLEKSVLGLWFLGEYGGQLHQSQLAFRQALSIFAPAAEAGDIDAIPAAYAKLVGILLAGLGHLTARQGKLDEGAVLAEQAIQLLRQATPHDHYKEALALLSSGWVLYFQGKHTEARQRAQEGLTVFDALGDRRNVADMLLLQGIAAFGEGKLIEAERLLQQAVDTFEAIGERVERGYGVQYLALIAIIRGEYNRAQQFLAEDLQLRQEFNDANGMTDLLLLFSRLAIAQGRYDQAETYLQQGLTMAEEAGRRDGRGFLSQLGQLRHLQGDDDEAEHLWQRSLTLAQAANHQPEQAQILDHLGRLAADRGEYTRAEHLFKTALSLWQQHHNEIETAVVRCHLGQMLAAKDESRKSEARRYLGQVLHLANQQQLAPLALEVIVGATGSAALIDGPLALELLRLVEQHPAATSETRSNARQRLIDLTATLPADLPPAAAAQPEALDWQAAADRLIDALSHPG